MNKELTAQTRGGEISPGQVPLQVRGKDCRNAAKARSRVRRFGDAKSRRFDESIAAFGVDRKRLRPQEPAQEALNIIESRLDALR